MIIIRRITLDRTRRHVFNTRTLQLGNGRVDAPVDDRDNHALTRVPLGAQRVQVVARVVRLIRRCHLAIHRLRGGSGSDGREHGRQGQRARRHHHAQGAQASRPMERKAHIFSSVVTSLTLPPLGHYCWA